MLQLSTVIWPQYHSFTNKLLRLANLKKEIIDDAIT